ncbi:ATP-binding protein [Bradyrhizobium sp. 62]|nr:ATP-binding protein [Bradyrhizobium sp. 62]MCK1364086.1 ATP-binding protein [Bradyrhizobium sp. 62]
MTSSFANPFERSRYLGSVSLVSPAIVRVNLPFATEVAPSQYAGHRVTRGQVGEFVVIESYSAAVIGRIVEIQLPDRDRLSVEPERKDGDEIANPIGIIRLLGSVDLNFSKSSRGIAEVPRIGDYVYLAHPDFMRFVIAATQGKAANPIIVGHLRGAPETGIALAPASLFGRHCAVLGSTGGGKSWSTARLIEQISLRKGKVILLDPTGEYHSLGDLAEHVHLGGQRSGADDTRRFVSFPYRHLNEIDVFAILQPSPGVQAPKLRDALMSLKLLHMEPSLADEDGYLVKQNAAKQPINRALLKNDAAIRAQSANYDITKLSRQILHECVQPMGSSKSHWGHVHDFSHSGCVTLCMRVESAILSSHLAPIFSPPDYMEDLTAVISSFMANKDASVLRISLRYLAFEHHTRELVVNAIGRHLLGMARDGAFNKTPMVVALDEAHQFLSKTVGDDVNKVQLDAFGLIAKEGRKYGLTCLLATQRPRDVPEDVLSQVGLFVVHRLINERDQAVVVNASGVLDGSAAVFLANLRDGEALIVGGDSIMPLPIMMTPPLRRPHLPDVERETWLNKVDS